MPSEEIEHKPYSEGTLVKLDIFKLYTRAWLPVFTARPDPHWKRLHLFDFFADHPTIRKYMDLERAGDHYHAHRVILDWYRAQVPKGIEYYLAPFSFRKGGNIYSLIFGSGHPRGMEQFLSVAWQKDKLNGEADYDLNREDFSDIEPYLPMLDMFAKPRKKQIFEAAFEKAIREQQLTTETALYLFCLESGMLPSHASPVLSKLKKEGVIECTFVSPSRESLKKPRPFNSRSPS